MGGQSEFHQCLQSAMKGVFVHQMLECSMKSTAFQADDEGSIPFTRSTDISMIWRNAGQGENQPANSCGVTPGVTNTCCYLLRFLLRRSTTNHRTAWALPNALGLWHAHLLSRPVHRTMGLRSALRKNRSAANQTPWDRAKAKVTRSNCVGRASKIKHLD
jgi:hypothetical protein